GALLGCGFVGVQKWLSKMVAGGRVGGVLGWITGSHSDGAFFGSPAELAVCPRHGSLGSGFCTATSLAKLRRHPAAGTQEALQKARQINICVKSREKQPEA